MRASIVSAWDMHASHMDEDDDDIMHACMQ
jgi:hypothetical protein